MSAKLVLTVKDSSRMAKDYPKKNRPFTSIDLAA